jgi:DNA-binding MarR family transcriptional regulator
VPKPLDLPFDPIARAAQIWERRFGDARAMAAVTAIMRVQQILLAQLDTTLRPYGLTFARYEALVLLSFSRAGALPMSLIGQRLMVHPTSVTNTIDRLEQQGLVVRRPNPQDGRGTLAAITAAGRETMAQATADLMAADFGMSGYDAVQLEQISASLRGLRVAAGDFADDAPASPAG